MGDEGERVTGRVERWEAVPVLALPDYVLFPGTLAPFHVFEPRYLEMLERCLSDRRLLVVLGLRPGWQERSPEDSRTFDVGGLGRVLSERRHKGGQMTVFVNGTARVRVAAECAREPGTAGVTRLVDLEAVRDFGHEAGVSDAHVRLLALAGNLARELGPEGAALGKVLGGTGGPGVLTNHLAGMIVDDPAERQELLETRSVLARCERLAAHVVRCLMERPPREAEGAGWIN